MKSAHIPATNRPLPIRKYAGITAEFRGFTFTNGMRTWMIREEQQEDLYMRFWNAMVVDRRFIYNSVESLRKEILI